MAHHGSAEGPNELRKEFERIEREFGLGATGKFPEGKCAKDDEGEIRYVIGHTHNEVVIDFGSPVKWLGLTPEQATELADTIRRHADACAEEE